MTDSAAHLRETANGRFNIEEAGTGTPLVLLHGFALDLRMWDDQFDAFSRRHRTVRYDLRGFGRSPVPGERPYSHAGDLLAILDALDIERAVVAGLSLGSNVALHFATEHADRTLGLILASPSLPGYPWRWQGDRPREEAGRLARTAGVEAAKAYWSGHSLFGSATRNPEIAARLARMTADYGAWHWTHDDPQAGIPALQPRLPGIERPVLVVSGGLDIDAYRELAEIIADGVPGAELCAIPDAGHLVNMEAPQPFTDAVLRFMASAVGKGGSAQPPAN
ncbi:alpha/beta fold hydrolase [Labrys monachus]|uniref:Pimeloyl-ACP methyl ester carboxylesterase n=1 Tax=Labrys monachus TaxID=217067 RepID=A0ABU0FFF3_9HYPH|nr:alpha/beta fold hydrolase [Labrys monachus]MDQ0393338.1 pimeloyl-ACP methyl ester carboxylesterase [Labrys monachus]